MGEKNINIKYILMLLRSLAKPLFSFQTKAVTYLSAMFLFFFIFFALFQTSFMSIAQKTYFISKF